MLRGAPGWRRIRPARWRVRMIGGRKAGLRRIPLECRLRPAAADGGVGVVNERQILALLGREVGPSFARHLI